jgi:hypothetical protein
VFGNKVHFTHSAEIPGKVATLVAMFPWKQIPGRRNVGKRNSEDRLQKGAPMGRPTDAAPRAVVVYREKLCYRANFTIL